MHSNSFLRSFGAEVISAEDDLKWKCAPASTIKIYQFESLNECMLGGKKGEENIIFKESGAFSERTTCPFLSEQSAHTSRMSRVPFNNVLT